MRSRLKAAARLLLAAMVAVGAARLAAQPKSDWEHAEEERNWREGDVTLPPYPKPADLIEFNVSATSEFRFFIDSVSVSVKDGVVRYTLVARSASGAENISYEGIRCKSATARVYAFGHGAGRWSPRGTDWRPVESRGAQSWQYALWRSYFCPNAIAVYDAAEGVAALRKGGHPHAGRVDLFGR